MCVNITECTRYTFSAQISLTNLTEAADGVDKLSGDVTPPPVLPMQQHQQQIKNLLQEAVLQ